MIAVRSPGARTISAVCGLGLSALAGLWWIATDRAAPRGLVIVTLDTTRADRLSPYGFMNVSLPHLERLAREGVVFDRATSVAPLTLPAHTSLFTGLLPPHHGVGDNADAELADAQTTLAEVLSAQGFRTAAFVGSVVLDPDRGLKQGFEEYASVGANDRAQPLAGQRPANEVVSDAIRWLDTVGESRFFLWVHLYDPHRPYDPPEPHRSLYGHNLYVGEIAFADAEIGRLLSAVNQKGMLDRSVILVAGDHGESLGDHGERDHGIFIYESVLRVPLIVRAPRMAPSRVAEVVRLTDVMPTVLELLGVPSPPTDGVSVVDLMTGRRRDLKLEAYSESLYPERLGLSPLRALREDRFKLIVAPRPELYDLFDDPFEQRNIYDDRRALAETMAARVAAIAKGRGSDPAARTVATPDVQARLASLGYVASSPARSPESPLVDPKDCTANAAEPRATPRWRPACGTIGVSLKTTLGRPLPPRP